MLDLFQLQLSSGILALESDRSDPEEQEQARPDRNLLLDCKLKGEHFFKVVFAKNFRCF